MFVALFRPTSEHCIGTFLFEIFENDQTFCLFVQAGNVYYISRCTLKPANKQYNTMKNDFEMSMTSDTEVVLCYDNNDDIPTLQFNFSPISQLENMKKDDTIGNVILVGNCCLVREIFDSMFASSIFVS